MPSTSKKSGMETRANSTTAVPRSSRPSRLMSPQPPRARRGSRTRRDAGGAAGVGALSTICPLLQLAADAAEDPRNLMTERSEDDDRHDCDQGQQERVPDERLTLLTLPHGIPQRRGCEIRPHRENTKHIHRNSSSLGFALTAAALMSGR